MGAVSRSIPTRLTIGTTAERFIDHAECDFLIVKPYTVAKDRYFPAEDAGTPADVAVLEEIRDLLAARQGPGL